MEKLIFDSGIKEYQINDRGILRFNPSDPNVYARFVDALEGVKRVEDVLITKGKEIENQPDQQSGAAVLKLMVAADREVKNILNRVFGTGNDLDEILDGINLLAIADNGERVITNFLAALQPIMLAGAENCAKQQADAAVAEAERNRALRQVQ
jgi:hypothetical protein